MATAKTVWLTDHGTTHDTEEQALKAEQIHLSKSTYTKAIVQTLRSHTSVISSDCEAVARVILTHYDVIPRK